MADHLKATGVSVRALVLFALMGTAPALWAQSPPPPMFTTANVYHPPANNGPTDDESLTPGQKNIVIGVHGWTSYPELWWLNGNNSWNDPEQGNPGMRSAILDALGSDASSWDTWGVNWSEGAAGGVGAPSTSNEINAQLQGQYIANIVASGDYTTVDLIGHSLGARVIETAAEILRQVKPSIYIQTTFLDAYQPYNWGLIFGSASNFSEQYYTTTDVLSGNLTAGQFPNCLNVNMDAFVQPRPADYVFPPAPAQLDDEYWQHNSPAFFYRYTALNPTAAQYGGYGYALSPMSGNMNPGANANYATGQNLTLNADGSISNQTKLAPVVDVAANKASLNLGTTTSSGNANTIFDTTAGTASLTAYGPSDPSPPATAFSYVDYPITFTQPVNYFQFNYTWLDMIDGDGQFTFYINVPSQILFAPNYDALLWATDSSTGFAGTTLSTGKIIWTGVNGSNQTTTAPLPAGTYELRFRLDTLDGTQSAFQISDFQAGLLAQAVPEPGCLLMVASAGAFALLRRDRRRSCGAISVQ